MPDTPLPWRTLLSPEDEMRYQMWSRMSEAPQTPDYDMRGYFMSNMLQDPRTAHYPDTWKTPLHKTFSNESIYGTPSDPHWAGDVLYSQRGKMMADERSKAQQDVYKAIDNQSSPYTQTMRSMQGIPTAEQEALQAPAIDPVMLAALGPTFGLRQMLQSAAMAALSSELPGGSSQTKNTLAMIPGPNLMQLFKQSPTLDSAAAHMFGSIQKYIEKFGFDPETATEIARTDDPEFTAMTGSRGDVPQHIDTYQRLLRDIRGENPMPYPGAEVGRPLGLAAMLHMLRNAYSQLSDPAPAAAPKHTM